MESSECLLTSNLNDFLLKLTNFTWNPQMQVNFFLQIIFYKNRIFTKTIFLLNHTSWGYFLDYMNLPYQFGILRMCTFCWFDWFLSKPSIILVIHTNTCALFFSSDLISFSCLCCTTSCYYINSCLCPPNFSTEINIEESTLKRQNIWYSLFLYPLYPKKEYSFSRYKLVEPYN